MRVRVVAALVASAFVSLSANAGLFDDEEARKRVEELRGQIAELGKQAESVSRNQLDFANQVESIKAEIARLRGQVEVVTHELEAAQKRQKDFYIDLDTRLRKLETRPEPKPEVPAIDPAAETRAYETAVAALKAAKFREAADAFNAFIVAYPKSTLLASAHYWDGYAHSQLKDHARAAELFGKFAAGWPDDERVPGALESQVASLEALKDVKAAKVALELLADKYPASDAGKRAKARLKRK